MDRYKCENEIIVKIFIIFTWNWDIKEHFEEIVSQRVVNDKISKLEKKHAEQNDQILEFVHKINKMEAKNDTLENCIRAKSIVLEESLSDLEKKIEESNKKTLDDENIKTLDRRIYVLKTRYFCDICEMEFSS